MKGIIVTLLLYCLIISSCAQGYKVDQSKAIYAKQQAIRMSQFLIDRNADSVIVYHYPKITSLLGGTEKALVALKNSWENQKVQGINIESDSIGEPSTIIYFKELYQCTIPQKMVLNGAGRKFAVNSTLIGLSTDEGNKWYYIDATGNRFKTIQATFPEISPNLNVPKQTPAQEIK